MWFCFRKCQSIGERLGAFLTGGPFNHVDIIMDDPSPAGAYAAYQFQTLQRYDLAPARFDSTQYVWVDARASPEQKQRARIFLDAQLGSPYNYAAFLACPFNAPHLKSTPGSWFCSELCATVLAREFATEEQLMEIGARAPCATSPNRFFKDLEALGFQTVTAVGLGDIKPADGKWW
jgi:hypothetical protein